MRNTILESELLSASCCTAYQRFFNWNRAQTKKVLADIDGENQVIKVAKLLALPEFAAQRKELKESFKDFHLLRDRFEYLEYIYSDPKKCLMV